MQILCVLPPPATHLAGRSTAPLSCSVEAVSAAQTPSQWKPGGTSQRWVDLVHKDLSNIPQWSEHVKNRSQWQSIIQQPADGQKMLVYQDLAQRPAMDEEFRGGGGGGVCATIYDAQSHQPVSPSPPPPFRSLHGLPQQSQRSTPLSLTAPDHREGHINRGSSS